MVQWFDGSTNASETPRIAAYGGPTAGFLSAFGFDVYGAARNRKLMSAPKFRTMSGAGHRHFLGFMTELAMATGHGHLLRALFRAWDYADGPAIFTLGPSGL